MSKTVKYLIAIVVLLGLNLTLLFSEQTASSSSFDQELFLVKDTASINSISIETKKEKIGLVRETEGWMLNGQYKVDQNFLKILFTILNKVEVKRQLGEMGNEDAGNVQIEFATGESRTFNFTTDAIGTKSFFIENGIGYQVEVPGYRDNVVNIFELNEDQWRNRIVFDGSWRTIQRLSLTSAQNELQIQFNSQFFNVAEVDVIDSAKVVDYLNQFQFFQANEMISEGRFPELDKVKLLDPLAILRIDDIKSSEETVFRIYPNSAGQSYHLVTKNDQEMMVFDGRRVQTILRSNRDFAAQ